MKSFYFNFFGKSTLKAILFTFVLVGFFTKNTQAQIIPAAGETECFVAANGGVFVDHGGTSSNPQPGSDPGSPGDYLNCNCETVTTLCSPDGSAITIEFTTFDVFATFDFIQIFDGDTNVGAPMYHNGVGGANAGDETLAEMIASNGSSTFTSATGCITVSFFATGGVDDFGWEASVTVGSGATHPGDNLVCGTNLNCLAPPNISVDNITETSAEILWEEISTAVSYNIEYGLAGFALGTGTFTNTTDLMLPISGLTVETGYEFYIQTDCGGGEMSNFAGPFSFSSALFNDVGIIAVNSPATTCGLGGQETVSISLQNFGDNALSLIPFKYSVNGVEAGVLVPVDGYFTNVLDNDEIVDLDFTTTFDFSQPGEYTIAAWTELDGDPKIFNDTAYLTISNIPIASSLPYVQNFEDGNGGWAVGSDGVNSTWDFGVPEGTDIPSAASGANAWVTNLEGNYNNNELSYIISNCYDFSSLTSDPSISFSLNYDTDNADGAWLESSLDGGTTWTKVGAMGIGVNWYNNNIFNAGDVWAGNSGGWIFAKSTLDGVAGQSDVRLRFVFDSNFFTNAFDGIGIDDVTIFMPLANDVASQSLVNTNVGAGCGSGDDQLTLTIFNNGTAAQSGFDVAYQIDDNPPVVENVGTLGLVANASGEYTFTTPFNISGPGVFNIKAWTELAGELDLSNDTAYFSITNFPIVTDYPYNLDFEENTGGWTVSPDGINPSWAYGEPNGTDIPDAANGINAWVTNLNGNYNNSETSYLVSNCMDFSSLVIDPSISFSINYDTELNYDGGWLELSIDGGATWAKVGTMGSGINWYNFNNTFTDLDEVWAGNSGGWIVAKNVLAGTAGLSEVLVRFAFDSDPSVNGFDGIGIDDISVFIPLSNDVASQSVVNSNAIECGNPMDEVTITIFNNGLATQSGFDVAYQVNGATPVVENVGGLTIGPDESATYTFSTPFDATLPGLLTIVAWTELAGELNIANDTTNYSFSTFQALPFKEDFEGMVLPNGWSTDEFNPISNAHNNISYVAFDNIYSFDPSFELISPPIGPLETGDSLFFDYRYVNFLGNGANPTILAPGAGDQLNIQISTDCGATYTTLFTVDETNHISSNEMAKVKIDVSSFVGEFVKFRFEGIWGSGDYYLDIDNINVFQCAPLNFSIDSSPEFDGGADGTATVTPLDNNGPYTYQWDFGGSTATVTGLEAGDYSVTVFDVFGCSGVVTITVDMETGIEDLDEIQTINLFPNPTSDIATLEMAFSKSVDVHVQLINMVGQVLYQTTRSKTTEELLELDLKDYSSGMYFVRIKVGDQTVVKKLSKTQR